MEKWSSGGLIIDFYDDIFLGTLREEPGLVEKLGSVRPMTHEKLAELSDSQFGLVIADSSKKLRKYPVHDQGHTLLAKEYFEKNANKLTPTMQTTAAYHILRACKIHGIDGLDNLKKFAGTTEAYTNVVDPEFKTVEPTAGSVWHSINVATLPDKDFALLKVSEDKTVRMYPISSPDYLHRGVQHFNAEHHRLDPVDRVKVATAMVKRAGVLKEEIDTSVIGKYATTQENPNFDLFITMRKELLNTDTDSADALDQLVEKRAEYKGQSFGRALEIFDKATGLDSLWDVTIPDPYCTCYSINNERIGAHGIEKEASDEEWLRKLAESDKLSDVFGKSTVEEFRRNPVAVFNSLPVQTRQLLRDLGK